MCNFSVGSSKPVVNEIERTYTKDDFITIKYNELF